ncbi:hypothetical protein [Azohydromonas australica]|uniref:hypothetical protein n=1 Tax=Azohydromonas australica TaxID=364039 RepID=UPI00041E510E|nr:hypothetical protein [Azohydromonas australica]
MFNVEDLRCRARQRPPRFVYDHVGAATGVECAMGFIGTSKPPGIRPHHVMSFQGAAPCPT